MSFNTDIFDLLPSHGVICEEGLSLFCVTERGIALIDPLAVIPSIRNLDRSELMHEMLSSCEEIAKELKCKQIGGYTTHGFLGQASKDAGFKSEERKYEFFWKEV